MNCFLLVLLLVIMNGMAMDKPPAHKPESRSQSESPKEEFRFGAVWYLWQKERIDGGFTVKACSCSCDRDF